MNYWNKLACELACHSIHIGNDGSVSIMNAQGRSEFNSTKEAFEHVCKNVVRNIGLLLELWEKVADLDADISPRPSNEATQRLFVSALKHLAREASSSEILIKKGIKIRLNELLSNDVMNFSQATMNKVIRFRLSIDWLSHLVFYDRYRAELLGLSVMRESMVSLGKKVAFYMDNMDTPIIGERATPFKFLRDSISDHREPNDGRPDWERKRNEGQSYSLPNDNPMSGVYMIPDFDSGLDGATLWSDRYTEGVGGAPINTRYQE